MNKALIKDIKVWLKKEGNSEALLASKLGYDSSMAIRMWLNRERVPKFQWQRVKEIVKQ